MDEFKNLDALADQLYQDGMEKARKESEIILQETQMKAEQLLADAKKSAEEIISKAKKEAEKHRSAVQSEISQKGKQAKQDLKTGIEELINCKILDEPLKELLSDTEFVKQLITSALKGWEDGKDVELVIPEVLKEMESDLKTRLHHRLPGLKVTPNKYLKYGFKVENHEKGYILSFTDSDFKALFEPYLTAAVRETLFNADK